MIRNVAHRWEEVATRIHFDLPDISRVQKDNPRDRIGACYRVFSEWLDGYSQEPVTWKTVFKALKSLAFMKLL